MKLGLTAFFGSLSIRLLKIVSLSVCNFELSNDLWQMPGTAFTYGKCVPFVKHLGGRKIVDLMTSNLLTMDDLSSRHGVSQNMFS